MSLTRADFEQAAKKLGCQVAAIMAVADVEAPRGGFDKSGKPAILFEAHKFSKHTSHRYDSVYPDISSRSWNRKLYASDNAGEHARLEKASTLNREAALKSASWGKFQILGENWKQCGSTSLQGFINSVYHSEYAQLGLFVNYIMSDIRLLKAIQNLAWSTFARIYNGPAYAENKYDVKMAAAFRKFS